MKKEKKQSSRTNYSEAFKRQVISEFESGLSSKATLKRKYGISGHSCIDNWLKKYGKFDYHNYLSIGRPMKDKDKQYIKELEAKLRVHEKHLEKQLIEKQAELDAYKKFIEIAERELNIKIIKKSGTKQSKR
jgi:transposase-like protein